MQTPPPSLEACAQALRLLKPDWGRKEFNKLLRLKNHLNTVPYYTGSHDGHGVQRWEDRSEEEREAARVWVTAELL